VRSDSLAKSMSEYLITEIAATTNIALRLTTEVVGAHGTDQLSGLELRNCATGETETVPAAALFILIGAEPGARARRDRRGFILTGRDLLHDGQPPEGVAVGAAIPSAGDESSGCLRLGDVRQRSMKRVASAVGEGATAISLIHEYLQEHNRT
jgi:thioredoxin reductase (NADPH)